jgi:hypothetical protein
MMYKVSGTNQLRRYLSAVAVLRALWRRRDIETTEAVSTSSSFRVRCRNGLPVACEHATNENMRIPLLISEVRK